MILTNCAACAAPLDHDAPRCVRCKTRYCNSTCQHDHWRRGHKQICKKIHRGGNAEQYHADKEYKAVVAVAVEACAEDTKGQTCYICTEALHWKTKESIVRGCACRGTAGFAHVSCLAEQATILRKEAEENNLDDKACNERWARWEVCSLCEQNYHDVVFCALGWACWKTYVDRPETKGVRRSAMTHLGNGLSAVGNYADALFVQEAELSLEQRIGTSEEFMLIMQNNIANTYQNLGRLDKTLLTRRDVCFGYMRIKGEKHRASLMVANNYAASLKDQNRFDEVKSLLRKRIPMARRVLGETDIATLTMRWQYAEAEYRDVRATLGDLREAATTLEETERTARRVLGNSHPTTRGMECHLQNARAALSTREGTPP